MEAGRLGFTCEQRRGFHLNTDLCAVRIVDSQGRTLGPGETGEVVISNLRNRAVVLLNYRLGDIGEIREDPCPCGRTLPVLEKLIGRRGVVLRTPDGRSVSDLVVSEHCSEVLEGVLFWQIIEEAVGRLRWPVVPRSGTSHRALELRLVTETRNLMGVDTVVSVEVLSELPVPETGKVPRLVLRDTRELSPSPHDGYV